MEIRDEDIKNQAQTWANEHIEENFSFRKYQLEAIVTIIKNVLYNRKIQVVEAPTGAGKSFIGIVSAGVLWDYYQKKSYILASDLALYKQYEDAIKKYKLPWGTLKGQDNYICGRNGHKISNSHCKIAQVATYKLTTAESRNKAGYSCGESCKYIQDLITAARAPVTLMTYALYFIRVHPANVPPMYPIKEGHPNLNLYTRDFVIGDEAHNLPSLVQNQFSPYIDSENLQFAEDIVAFAEKETYDKIVGVDSLKEAVNYMIKFERPDQVFVCSKRISDILASLAEFSSKTIKKTVSCWSEDRSKEATKYLNAASTCQELYDKFKIFNEVIETCGESALVKSLNKTKTGVKLNCAYENRLIYEYFHKVANCELLMSATIGDVDIYKSLIGADKYPEEDFVPIEIPSTFDFSQSPIYYSTQYKMSYREKAISIPHVVQHAIEICDKNQGKRGLIHTGSYEITEAFFKAIPPKLRFRVIRYSSSKDKDAAIQRFLNSQDGILVGPSLLEGLDFAGDKCRFNIFMKMPYASLGDNLVKAKMRLFPDWYSLDVCSRLAQGIGRGVRFNSDWCNTYILDACFTDIINNKRSVKNLSESTLQRLVRMD